LRKGNIIYYLINAAVFIILETAALNILRNNAPLQNTWFAKGGQAIMGTVWGFTQNIKDYFSLKKANNTLAIENHNLRIRIAELEDMLAEDTRAAMFPDDGISNGHRYIPATISKISNNSQHNYIIINKGAKAGITKGAGIITGKGAIGIVDAVSENYSYARSFKNHEMSISARLGKSGPAGQLCWDGVKGNGGILKEIPHHVSFSPGDTIYTSGYSSIFPPDIPLGITGSSRVVNGATHEIRIRLFEDFEALRYVTVVTDLGKDEIKILEGME